jgi:hypothetical protein
MKSNTLPKTMTIKKLLPIVAIALGVFSVVVQCATVDEVRERLDQRRRDLQTQGPMSKEEATYMKILINKRALRITSSHEDRRFATDALRTSNPFAKVLDKGRKPLNERPNRAGGRRTSERGASSTPTERDLGETYRKGSKKAGSNKSGGPGYVSMWWQKFW